MASGRQFQSTIVFGKNENLKTCLFAYGTRNLNWWLPLVRLSKCWIKYSQPSISIRPWVSLYISVNLDCLLLDSSVAHPKSLIMSVTLACLLQFCGQNWAALRRTLSRALMSFFKNVENRSQATLVYSSFGRTRDGYAISFTFFGQFQRLRCIVPGDVFALVAVMETWAHHLSLLLMVTPRYGKLPTLHHRWRIFSGVDCPYLRW